MKLKINIILLILTVVCLWDNVLFAQNRMPIPQRFEIAQKRLEFARDIQASINDRQAGDLLADAGINLRRARRQFRAGRLLFANRSLNKANNSISQALKILLREPIKQRREKLKALISEAENIVPNSGNPEAQKTLDRGLVNASLAAKAFQRNNFQKSLKHYNQAYFLIQKAIDQVRNNEQTAGQEADNESYRFDQLLSKNMDIISSSTNETVHRNKQLAMKLARKAEAARQNADFRTAIDFYHKATRLLLRALDIAQGKAERSTIRVYEEVALLDELIDNYEPRIKDRQFDEQTSFLVSRVKQLQDEAHQALDDKNYDQALVKAQFARDMVERLLKKNRGSKISPSEKVARDFGRLEKKLHEISKYVTESTNEEAKILFNYSNVAKNKAELSFKKNNLRLAIEGIRMANRFALAADELVQFGPGDELSSEFVSKRLERLEIKLLRIQSKLSEPAPPGMKFCLEQTEKMLSFARQNYDKGFFHVSDACLRLGKSYLEQCNSPGR